MHLQQQERPWPDSLSWSLVGYKMVAQGGMLHTSKVSQAQDKWGPGQSRCQDQLQAAQAWPAGGYSQDGGQEGPRVH